jgi:hypothetical protein
VTELPIYVCNYFGNAARGHIDNMEDGCRQPATHHYFDERGEEDAIFHRCGAHLYPISDSSIYEISFEEVIVWEVLSS